MATITDLKTRVTREVIEPEFEPEKLKSKVQKIGFLIEEPFIQAELSILTQKFFLEIKPSIQKFLETKDIKHLYPDASTLDIETTFKPIVKDRLKRICRVIPGGFSAYAPGPNLWSWLATLWNGKNSP